MSDAKTKALGAMDKWDPGEVSAYAKSIGLEDTWWRW